MPRLYVVRHTEPAVTGVLLGQSDPPLSETGRRHAAELLAESRLSIVYSSPLRRALETAQMLVRDATLDIVADLREITYGDWDGKTWDEIESAGPGFAARKLHDWPSVTPPGGEAWPEFVARVTRAFEHIKRGPRPAAIVAHAAVNRILTGRDQNYGDVYEL